MISVVMNIDLSRKIKDISSNTLVKAAFICTLLLSGGFYAYSTVIAGILICIGSLLCLVAKMPVRRVINTPILVILFFIPLSLWAVDTYRNMAGFLRISPLIPFIWLLSQKDLIDRKDILDLIPVSGALLSLLGVLAYPNPYTRSLFWMSDRLGGTFQYANTCALYMLLGIALLIRQKENNSGKESKRKDLIMFWSELILLCVGLLLTGSRSIILLAIAWGIYKSVRYKAFRIPFFAVLILGLSVGGVYVAVTGNMQNIGRIFTVFSKSSTFYGRLLYMKDAVKIVLRHPFGLGFDGYYYVQPMYQNGVYDTRFVHNDLLQLILDAGIIPAILLFVWLIRCFINRKIAGGYVETAILILTASLFDFHLQYMLILMNLLLCVDFDKDHRGVSESSILSGHAGVQKLLKPFVSDNLTGKVNRRECGVVIFIVLALYIVIMIPFTALRVHNDELVLKFFPHDTESELRILEKSQEKETAYTYATDILSHNKYIATAYRHLAFIGLMDGDINGAMDNFDHVLKINRYHLNEYEAYDKILEEIIENTEDKTDPESIKINERASKTRASLPEILDDIRASADPLAWKIRDIPKLIMYE